MDVVWHDDKRIQDVVSKDVGVVMNGLYYHVGDRGLAKVEGTGARLVQQSIQDGGCLSGA